MKGQVIFILIFAVSFSSSSPMEDLEEGNSSLILLFSRDF